MDGTSKSPRDIGPVIPLGGGSLHPSHGGWARFLTVRCELRDEHDGVRYFGATNCNYILFPTGDLVSNFGYHGVNLMGDVREKGWRVVLDEIKAWHAEEKARLLALLAAQKAFVKATRAMLDSRATMPTRGRRSG